MDYYKSKYTTMPDNSYFDKCLANGDNLSDIFDDVDNLFKYHTEDKGRPVLVRVGKLYNYVVNNFIFFDNWFVFAEKFDFNEKWSYAYRRYNDNGKLEGGVLIKRNGSYVTREEFLKIYLLDSDKEYLENVVVRQQDGLFNLVNLNKGIKVERNGIKADTIDWFYPRGGYYRIAKGNKLNDSEETELWCYDSGKELSLEKNMKCNFYHVKKGIISPSLWFNFIMPFTYVNKNFDGISELCNHTIVYLNGKKNFINQDGKLLSEIWFDKCHLHADGTGDAATLKSERLKYLPDTVGDNYDYNPDKYNLYKIDYYGKIIAV